MTIPRPFDFASDNAVGIDPRILAAIVECNAGVTTPYGMDPISREVDAVYSDLFEHETFVFAAPTGTAANGLALGAITPSYGAIFCHEASHIFTTECGAPEFFSGGARQVPLRGANGKLSPRVLQETLLAYQRGSLHQLHAATLSLTQATDFGTVYSLAELCALTSVAHEAGLKVHLDGARFANAMVSIGCSPADLSWKAGIDVLSFGTTKNGTMNAEAVLTFDPATAKVLRYMHKRAGFLQSKMRFTAAQLTAYVRENCWTENAARANKNASRLLRAIHSYPGARLEYPVDANEIFVHLPPIAVAELKRSGIELRPWAHSDGDMYRAVTSYCDSEALVRNFELALSGEGRASVGFI